MVSIRCERREFGNRSSVHGIPLSAESISFSLSVFLSCFSVRDKIALISSRVSISIDLPRDIRESTSELAVSSVLFLLSGHSFGKEFIPSNFSELYDFLAIAFASHRAFRDISLIEDRSIFSIYSMVMCYPFKAIKQAAALGMFAQAYSFRDLLIKSGAPR
jgi:hypothetical protein